MTNNHQIISPTSGTQMLKKDEESDSYQEDYDDLDIKEDNEEYIYDDDNDFDEISEEQKEQIKLPMQESVTEITVSDQKQDIRVLEEYPQSRNKTVSCSVQNTQNIDGSKKKKRIDIDNEDSIPDIRQSRRSTTQILSRKQLQPDSRELSSNSRPRPDDKIKKGLQRNRMVSQATSKTSEIKSKVKSIRFDEDEDQDLNSKIELQEEPSDEAKEKASKSFDQVNGGKESKSPTSITSLKTIEKVIKTDSSPKENKDRKQAEQPKRKPLGTPAVVTGTQKKQSKDFYAHNNPNFVKVLSSKIQPSKPTVKKLIKKPDTKQSQIQPQIVPSSSQQNIAKRPKRKSPSKTPAKTKQKKKSSQQPAYIEQEKNDITDIILDQPFSDVPQQEPPLENNIINVHQHFNQPNIMNLNQFEYQAAVAAAAQQEAQSPESGFSDENPIRASSSEVPAKKRNQSRKFKKSVGEYSREGLRSAVGQSQSNRQFNATTMASQVAPLAGGRNRYGNRYLKSAHASRAFRNHKISQQYNIPSNYRNRSANSSEKIKGLPDQGSFKFSSTNLGLSRAEELHFSNQLGLNDEYNSSSGAMKHMLRQSHNMDFLDQNYGPSRQSKLRLQSAVVNPKMKGINSLIYTPGIKQRKLSRGSSSQANLHGAFPFDAVATTNSNALRMSPSALLKIGQNSMKQMQTANQVYVHKKKHSSEFLKKEDIYDKMIMQKTELNRVNDDNTKFKTKNAIQSDQLKVKDRFIDELLKSTYVMSKALGMGGYSNLKKSLAQARAAGRACVSGSEPPKDDQNQDLDTNVPKLPTELKASSQNYFTQNFIEKGPYNQLRLKRQVNDYKEIIQTKNQEIDDLKKNLKSTKAQELTEEVKMYQTECHRLRKISEQAVTILLQNGLGNHLKQSRGMKTFVKQVKNQRNSFEYERIENTSPKNDVTSQNDMLVQQLMEHGNHMQKQFNDLTLRFNSQTDKIEHQEVEKLKQDQYINNLHQRTLEQQQLIETLRVQLEKKEQEKPVLSQQYLFNPVIETAKPEIRQECTQTEEDLESKNKIEELSGKVERYLKNIRIQDEQLSDKERRILELQIKIKEKEKEDDKNLDDDKDRKELEESLNEEIKKKELLKDKVISQQELLEQNKNEFEKLETKYKFLKEKFDQPDESKQQLIKQVEIAQKDLIEQNNEYIKLQKSVKEIQSENQIKQAQIDQLSIKLQKAIEELQSSQGMKVSSQEFQDLQLTVQRLSDAYNVSQATNSQLLEEQKHIHELLENVNLEDIDERSDMISQLKSNIFRTQKSFKENKQFAKSPTRLPPKKSLQIPQTTSQQKKRDVEIIEENAEDDFEGPDDDLLNLNKDIQKEQEQQDRLKRPMLGNIGKSNSSVDKKAFHFLDKAKKQKTQHMLDQIDDVRDAETAYDDNVSQFMMRSQKPLTGVIPERQTYLERDNPAVHLGLERLARLQQLHRVLPDQIEKLFGEGFRANKVITLIDLSAVFCDKLFLNQHEAVAFARFLVEEKPDNDDGNSDNIYVDFDPLAKIDLQLIIVRLMANSLCPLIFTDQQEEEAKEVFTKNLQKKQLKFIRGLNGLSNGQPVNKIQFETFLKNLLDEETMIPPNIVECAFAYLSRGGVPFSNLRNFSQIQFRNCLLGFDSERAYTIFKEIETAESTSNNTASDQIPDQIFGAKKKGSFGAVIQSNNSTDPRINLKGSGISDRSGYKEIKSDISQNEAVTPVLGAQVTAVWHQQSQDNEIHKQLSTPNSSAHKTDRQNKASHRMPPKPAFSFCENLNSMNSETKQLPETYFNGQMMNSIEEEKKVDEVFSEDITSKGVDTQDTPELSPKIAVQVPAEKVDTVQDAPTNKIDELMQDKDPEQQYSDSRSETDFDMQQSLPRNFVPEFLNKRESRSSSVKEVKYNQQEKDMIRLQGLDATLGSGQNLLKHEVDECTTSPPIISSPKEKREATSPEPVMIEEAKAEQEVENNSSQTKDIDVNCNFDSQINSVNNKNRSSQYQSINTAGNTEIQGIDMIPNIETNKSINDELNDNIKSGNFEINQQTIENFNLQLIIQPEESKATNKIVQFSAPSISNENDSIKQEQKPQQEIPQNNISQLSNTKPDGVEFIQNSPRQFQAESPMILAESFIQPQLGQEEEKTEQEIELFNTLKICLSEKIQDELLQGMNEYSLQRVVECSMEVFQKVSNTLKEQEITCLREFFHKEIHIIKQENDKGDNFEIEVVKPKDLISRFDELLLKSVSARQSNSYFGYQNQEEIAPQLDATQKQCLITVLCNPKFEDLILYQELLQVFSHLGITEGKPQNTQHMNYQILSIKSIRIINRLIDFLNTNNHDFNTFMGDIVAKQVVKTKRSTEVEVEVFMAKKFFLKLEQNGLKGKGKICRNLCEFLCIDKKYTHYLMLKKLKRCIVDFNNTSYFKNIGSKKRKIILGQEDNSIQVETQEKSSQRSIPQQSEILDIMRIKQQKQ